MFNRSLSATVWAIILAAFSTTSFGGLIVSAFMLVKGRLSQWEGFALLVALLSSGYTLLLLSIWVRSGAYGMKILYNTLRYVQSTCPTCHYPVTYGDENCEVCGSYLHFCEVCKGVLRSEEEIVVAPCCGAGFHLDHFEPWVRLTGRCPACGSEEVLYAQF